MGSQQWAVSSGRKQWAVDSGQYLRGAGGAEMPRKEGERAAREPRRYRLELPVSPRFLMPELDRASPPGAATSYAPASHIHSYQALGCFWVQRLPS